VGGGELLGGLKAQAEARGIAARVAFLGGKSQPDVVALLREADLFVLPAKEATSGDRDGLPNVLMEAASQGLAIVATDFAGTPEFIRDGVEGQLVPPGDWEALSNAVNLLGRDPHRRARLGAAAFQRLRRDFGMSAGVDLLAARFRRLLGTEPDASREAAE
jgi:glycosyltransferase involved in cell wall biosynthesis